MIPNPVIVVNLRLPMYTSFNARALGLKLSMNETLRLASQYGFGGIDVMVRDAVEQNVDLTQVKRRMDDLGLRPGAFPFPFDWRGADSQFEEDLIKLPALSKAAAVLGLERTATWVMPETPERPTGKQARWNHDQAILHLHIQRLHRIASVLNDFGIRLGLEVIGVETSRTGKGWPFLHRLDQLEELRAWIDVLGPIPVGVLLDSWHLYAAGEPLENALFWDVSDVVWVHVADLPAGASTDRTAMIDAVRGLPGEHGAIDSRALLAALAQRGYDGPVTAEPLAGCISLQGLTPDQAALATIQALKSVWPT